MDGETDSRTAHLLQLASDLCIYLVLASSALVAFGWAAGLPALTGFSIGTAKTSVATLCGFALGAGAVYGLRHSSRSGSWLLLSRACAGLLAGAACYTLARYAANLPDAAYLLGSSLGRVSPATAVSFGLLAGATLVVDKAGGRISAVATALGLFVVYLALVGYANGPDALAAVFVYAAMALPTALMFLMLFVGLLLARPRQGWGQYAFRGDRAGAVFRTLIPAVIFVPLLLGDVTARAVNAGAFKSSFGFTILVVAMTVMLAVVVCLVSAWLARSDATLQKAHEDLQASTIALSASEARLRFLDTLGKETAKSVSAEAVLAATTSMLGQHLNLAICAYADMEQDQDHFTIRGDWHTEESSSIVGDYSLADFGALAVKKLRAGLPLVVNDVLTELAPEAAATFQSIGIAATICMPLVKEGRLTALMAIHSNHPRIWNADDLALTGEVTERSWAHIERVRSEALVRESARQLVQAQKMEAIGNLTGGMAHDFNNLLGVIIGNIDLLRERLADDPTTDQLAGEALSAALSGAELTQRLLAFARRQPLQPRLIQPNDLLAGIVKLLKRTLGEPIEIGLDLAPDVSPILVDPAQLESSLTNLANNARDAMPKGGKLTIATANRYLDADYAASHAEVRAGDYVLIEVSDSGTGIAPDAIEHIFEPFFTTKEQGKGTGLGLSMVFGFMKQSGGHINVYSEVGVGTTFRLYLPQAEAVAATEDDEKPLAQVRRGDETVLVVEDNAGLRAVVVRQLTELGYTVLEADSGPAALAVLEAESVDLLFTDVIMPGGMNGYELGRAARSRWPRTKVLLTSGFPEEKINGNAAAPWNMRLLIKPYRKDELARVVRDVLNEAPPPTDAQP